MAARNERARAHEQVRAAIRELEQLAQVGADGRTYLRAVGPTERARLGGVLRSISTRLFEVEAVLAPRLRRIGR